MDRTLLRARIEEILEDYDTSTWDPEVREEFTDLLLTEFTKVDLEDTFDAEAEDELDEG